MLHQIITKYCSKKYLLTLFLISAIIAGYFGAISSEHVQYGYVAAIGLDFSVEPSNQIISPGDTAQYTVSVLGDETTDDTAIDVEIVFEGDIYSEGFIRPYFSNNKNRVSYTQPPYSEILTIETTTSVKPGTYTIIIWAEQLHDLDLDHVDVTLVIHSFEPIPGYTTTPPSTQEPPTGTPPSPQFDFTISLIPSTLTVEAGQPANFQISLTYSDSAYFGTTVTIQVGGLGSDMTYQLTPQGGLTISTSSTTPPGTYSINIVGSALGVTRQTSCTLIVTTESAPPPTQTPSPDTTQTPTTETPADFSITISPTDRTVYRGEEPAIFIVSINNLGEFDEPVTLQVLGLPSDTVPRLSTTSSKVPFSTTLTIDTVNSTVSGTYTLTIDASGGDKSHSETVSLTIKDQSDESISADTKEDSQNEDDGYGGLTSDLLINPTNILLIIIALLIIALTVIMVRRGKTKTSIRPEISSGYCTKCGAQLKPGTTFCNSCGTRVN
jgi:hypothetical protein